jgi:phosphoribosylformimino-5-aminoimidazole carboxamide ribotide isomerase
MDVVPVMDLRGGRAVHARGGERARYPLVRGVLGSGEDPLALAAAFRDRLGCRTLYVADLDAIAGTGHAPPPIPTLAGMGIRVLLDAGVHTAQGAEALLRAGAHRVVVGLETLRHLGELGEIIRAIGAEQVVFSLDLRAGRPLTRDPVLAGLDPARIAERSAAQGVEQVLCLDLARVGSGSGPAGTIGEVRARLPGLRVLAGGGVRDAGDLARLAGAGCAAALVATALHEGTITGADLDRLRAGQIPSIPPDGPGPPPAAL